jgi:vancomycin resistance protein VanJ
MTFCYAFRPDICAAVTVWPAWVWFVLGLLVATTALRRKKNKPLLVITPLWLLYLFAFSEEAWYPLTFVRSVQALESGGSQPTIRVVTLNCAGGDERAALEAAGYQPDIVLLQESPARREVEEVGRRLFGGEAGVLYGLDASIIVRGKIEPVPLPRTLAGYFVQGRARVEGVEVEVISTRLLPAVFREDLWSPSCWTAHAENRRARREWLRPIAERVNALPDGVPIIVGGDFNAPQGDAVFRLLQPRLRDAFSEAGTTWGNTITNEMPFLRIDQIWISGHFSATSVAAHKTVHSDHRMVVGDLALTRQSRNAATPR